MISCLPGIGLEGDRDITFFPLIVDVEPVKHSQLEKSPLSKSRFGGQL
jgi:hypothetical protein